MAGFVNAKTQLVEARAEIERLRAQLKQFERTNQPKRKRIISRTYDDSIIDELIEWSEEGLFLDECLANWGIDMEIWQTWLANHVPLQEAVGPSRARARAAMLRTLREALKTRNAFPTSLADRIIAMVERENGTAESSAAALINVTFCPACAAADAQSAESEADGIDLPSERATA